MAAGAEALRKVARHALTGRGAHVETKTVFSGLSWRLAGARRRGVPHSLYQILNHMTFWQEWGVEWLAGRDPAIPAHASGSWPGPVAPRNQREWEAAVARFEGALGELDRRSGKRDLLSRHGRKSRLEMLQTIGAHNSYHAGQAVLLRQVLGAWPPPTGGLSW
jgi:hypothetical protein